jgi:hypothetical protein
MVNDVELTAMRHEQCAGARGMAESDLGPISGSPADSHSDSNEYGSGATMNAQVTGIHTCLVVALLATGCAHSHPEPVYRESLQQVSATVESVDSATRVVGLNDSDGLFYVEAGPEVRNFDQIRVGDEINVSYYEAVAAAFRPRSEGDAAMQVQEDGYRAPPGSRPAAATGHSVTTTVNIQSVDTSFNTVTFKRPDGSVHAVAVNSPQGQQFIKSLRPGDNVDVTYTEAVAVAVTAGHH